MVEPAGWIVESERGDPQKAAPCGADPKMTLSGVVNKAVGGSKLHLKVIETIYHPGHYRVALAVQRRERRESARRGVCERIDYRNCEPRGGVCTPYPQPTPRAEVVR
jgi:hypothetical protein